MVQTAVVLALLLALAGPAPPADPDAWKARLEAGDVALDIRADPRGLGGQVVAAIDSAAPPAGGWRAILDCERAVRMTPSVKRCRVVSRAADGRSEVREHLVRRGFLSPTLRSVSRLDLAPPDTIRFRCLEGDIDDCDGGWRLEPRAGGRATRVTYDNRARAPHGLPAGLAMAAMRHDVPAALRALRRESLAAAR